MYERLIKDPKSYHPYDINDCRLCQLAQSCLECPINGAGSDNELCGCVTKSRRSLAFFVGRDCDIPNIIRAAKTRYKELLQALKKNGWEYK